MVYGTGEPASAPSWVSEPAPQDDTPAAGMALDVCVLGVLGSSGDDGSLARYQEADGRWRPGYGQVW